MMNDKQQIEQLKEALQRYVAVYGKTQLQADGLYTTSELMSEFGIVALPKDAVVLTREEYEWLKDKAKELNNIYSNGFRTLAEVDELIKQERKETAKDFIFKVESYLGYNDDNETFTKKELLLILAEIAKEQYGVEVDE